MILLTDEECLTATEIARELKVNRHLVKTAIMSEQLRGAFKFGKRWYVPRTAISRWLNEVVRRDADRTSFDPDQLGQRPVHRGGHLLLSQPRILACFAKFRSEPSPLNHWARTVTRHGPIPSVPLGPAIHNCQEADRQLACLHEQTG